MIYYVEDDANIRDLALYTLRKADFEVEGFPSAEPFFEACMQRIPTLILLDIMLPGVDGLEILRRVRADVKLQNVPVMMLTAKGTEFDTVVGLDAGADDYLAKPFGMMELVSRVNALLRRSSRNTASGHDVIHCGNVALDLSARTATAGGRLMQLTLKEFDLLCDLIAHEGCVLSRAQLLEDVWDITYVGETRTVDVHVQTLRQKLEAAQPGAGSMIQTVRGVGYRVQAVQ